MMDCQVAQVRNIYLDFEEFIRNKTYSHLAKIGPGSLGPDTHHSMAVSKPPRRPNNPANQYHHQSNQFQQFNQNSIQSQNSINTTGSQSISNSSITQAPTPQPASQLHGMQKFIVPPRPSGPRMPVNSLPRNTSNERSSQSEFRPNLRPPPPPSEPAPVNQPTMPAGGFRLPQINPGTLGRVNKSQLPTNSTKQDLHSANVSSGTWRGNTKASYSAEENNNSISKMAEILKTPNAGVAGTKRSSLANAKPLPGAGRPKPKPKPVIQYPKCRSLYDYEARDIDELTLKENDIIEIIQECK